VSELTNVQLGEEIQRLAAHIDAALCEWLGMIAEFDRREAWGELGLASTAHSGCLGDAQSGREPPTNTCVSPERSTSYRLRASRSRVAS
jgi:hypothetical protein